MVIELVHVDAPPRAVDSERAALRAAAQAEREWQKRIEGTADDPLVRALEGARRLRGL
ncbi:hypothetical protein Q5424_07610 [Conexibacter sp. JD483]|uniref:hypothetical protein n=1 Tax=unclassified Conexibacter TaxID=2627773 RepID=UPI002727B111|nr:MULTISPECIES: hypothetical protein [unclassified Conexibacter]MDO8186034.1 hypothetical protein [Conexibacter sp. CPCC 205706]MDO8199524.1 hypothetical protein [Conexibacter sp. CPCC 205762]MDR9368941.1 hypothetical protein [Conexibacter sp. JD483]